MTGERAAAGDVDPILEAVERAREPGAMSRVWQRAWRQWCGQKVKLEAEVLQTHYKPFRRARLFVRVEVPKKSDRSRTRLRHLFVQLYGDAESATRRLSDAESRKRRLIRSRPPRFEIPEWQAIAWSLPEGPRLRVARSFLKRKAFLRFLERNGLPEARIERVEMPDLLRYVPRRRALFFWPRAASPAAGAVYIKVYAPGEDEPAAGNLGLLADARARNELGFGVPELILHDPKRRAVLMSEVGGRPLTERLGKGDEQIQRTVGVALASLHRSSLRPRARWTPRSELWALAQACADIALAAPALKTRLDVLIEALEERAAALEFEIDAPIHGNLFGDQILVDDGGLGVVDWDDLALGDPLYDLGRLMAHQLFVGLSREGEMAAVHREIAALRRAYEAAAGTRADTSRLIWQVATALLLRAKISALRTLAPGWSEQLRTAVGEAERLLSI